MVVKLGKIQLITIDGNKVSDHNRQPLQMPPTRIENKQRMADGTMRRHHVADKHTFNVTWTDLPGSATRTVDGFWGANDMENHYLTQFNQFNLTLTYHDGTTKTYVVQWSNFEKDLSKRGADDFYAVTASWEEV